MDALPPWARPSAEPSCRADAGPRGPASPWGVEWARPCAAALPRPCLLCHRWSPASVCPACLARFAQPLPRCSGCARPLPAAVGAARCGACLRRPPPWDQAWAAADYAFPWAGVISRFKFQGQPELARLGAERMRAALPASVAQAWRQAGARLVSVPLSDARLAERGHDQAWELARRLARTTGLGALAQALVRRQAEGHQVGADRAQRWKQLEHAFWVPQALAPRVAQRPCVLVDDVLTTGATAAAATAALRAAGASQVWVWVWARTPAPGETVVGA